MKDLINAIRGQKHCDWCVEKQPTWFDRLMRFDQLVGGRENRPWWERAACRWQDFNDRLGIWKLGRRWHDRFHPEWPYE